VQGERKAVFQAIVEETLAPQKEQSIQEQWREFQRDMFCEPFAISGFVNGVAQANIMVDSGCLSYSLCDPRFAKRNSLQRISVSPLGLEGFDGSRERVATEVAILDIDLDGYTERIFAYITPLSGHHDVFLGLPWIYKRDVRVLGNRKSLQIGSDGPIIRSQTVQESAFTAVSRPYQVSAVAFARASKRKDCQVFAASVADINKALQKLEAQTMAPDPAKLPSCYRQFLPVFDPREADKLPPFRGDGIDYYIELSDSTAEPP